MSRKLLLLMPLIAGLAFWHHPGAAGFRTSVEPAKEDRPLACTLPIIGEPGFRASVDAAMALSPAESIAAVTRLLEVGIKGISLKDAAWFFEKYHK